MDEIAIVKKQVQKAEWIEKIRNTSLQSSYRQSSQNIIY